MEDNNLNNEQLNEATGSGIKKEDQKEGKCVNCGESAPLLFLQSHGGLRKGCENRANPPKCPYCGGPVLIQFPYRYGVFNNNYKCGKCGRTFINP